MDINNSQFGGDQIFIQNNDGSISGYAHTGIYGNLAIGQAVFAGQQIGISNGSGTPNPHLHYTYRPGSKTNPATMDTPTADAITQQFQGVPRPSRTY